MLESQGVSTVQDIKSLVRTIYPKGKLFDRLLLSGRPYICPFHVLVNIIPKGSSMLDIGCGTGLFLNLAALTDRISSGLGFDANGKAVAVAQQGAMDAGRDSVISFRELSVESPWPDGVFQVVSMIDVLHHIDPVAQEQAIKIAISKVEPGGIFLFKDIGVRPFWRALANRLHDLVLARQWIHYVPKQSVARWAKEEGIDVELDETINMLWYGHELMVFRKPKRDE